MIFLVSSSCSLFLDLEEPRLFQYSARWIEGARHWRYEASGSTDLTSKPVFEITSVNCIKALLKGDKNFSVLSSIWYFHVYYIPMILHVHDIDTNSYHTIFWWCRARTGPTGFCKTSDFGNHADSQQVCYLRLSICWCCWLKYALGFCSRCMWATPACS